MATTPGTPDPAGAGPSGSDRNQSSNVAGQHWDKDLGGPQPTTATGRPERDGDRGVHRPGGDAADQPDTQGDEGTRREAPQP